MKIIKQGHKDDRMEVVCANCEAVLEITSADVFHERSSDSVWGKYFIKCPCCETKKQLERCDMTFGLMERCDMTFSLSSHLR